MKYIITESKLEKLVLNFLEQKSFVDDAQIEDGEVIIYLKYPVPSSDKIRGLAETIETMFNFHGKIYKPSNPRWTYKLVHNF